MADEREKQKAGEKLLKDDRERTVLWGEATTLAAELESKQKKVDDIHEQMVDMREELDLLRARDQQAHGQLLELTAMFWRGVRKEHKDWFRTVREAGLNVMFERIRMDGKALDSDGRPFGVKLIAVDPAMEEIKKIGRFIFRPGNRPNQDDEHAHGPDNED